MFRFASFFLLSLSITAGVANAGTVSSDGADLVLKTKGGFSLKTVDGQYSFRVGGRLMWDYNYAEENGVADEDDFHIRRARIYTKGDLGDWSYKAQFNIGNGNGGTPEDLYIRYKGFGKKAVVTVGKQNEPFGLELLESSKHMSFLERTGITEAYVPGRNEGVLLTGSEGQLNYALGLFEDGSAAVDQDDTVFTARVTFAPVKTDRSLVHIGAAVSKRPDNVDLAGFEFAASVGGVHAQAEYIASDSSVADTNGYYVQLGWFLTGEQRSYKKGVLGSVKPNNAAKGAWEVVARYEDGDGAFGDIELGNTDATSYGLGLNYFANKNIRLGVSHNWGKDNLSNDDGGEFRARIQLVY